MVILVDVELKVYLVAAKWVYCVCHNIGRVKTLGVPRVAMMVTDYFVAVETIEIILRHP
jgi:hypothetical protein